MLVQACFRVGFFAQQCGRASSKGYQCMGIPMRNACERGYDAFRRSGRQPRGRPAAARKSEKPAVGARACRGGHSGGVARPWQ